MIHKTICTYVALFVFLQASRLVRAQEVSPANSSESSIVQNIGVVSAKQSTNYKVLLQKADAEKERGLAALGKQAWPDAEQSFRKALHQYQQLYPLNKHPKGHWAVADTERLLGRSLRLQKKLKEARIFLESAYRQEKSIQRTSKYGGAAARLSITCYDIATLLFFQQEYREAEAYYSEAIDAATRAHPFHSHGLPIDFDAELQEKLGRLYVKQLGDYEKAVECFSQELFLRRNLFPTAQYPNGHSTLITNLYELAFSLFRTRDFDQAVICLLEAHDMWDMLQSGPSQLELSTIVNSLSQGFGAVGEKELVYLSKKRLLELFEESIGRFERTIEQSRIAQAHSGLAQAAYSLGWYDEAAKRAENALSIQRSLYPASEPSSGHRSIAQSCNLLGICLRNKGDWEEAEVHFKSACEILESIADTTKQAKPDYLFGATLTNWGDALCSIGKLEEAKEQCEKALEVLQKVYPVEEFPEGSDILAVAKRNLGSALSKLDEHEPAIRLLKESLAMQQGLFPVDEYPNGHQRFGETYLRLGRVLLANGNKQLAFEAYCHSQDAYQNVYSLAAFPHGHPSMRPVFEELAALADDLGDSEVAAESRNGLAALTKFAQPKPSDRQGELRREAQLLHDKGWRYYQDQRYDAAEVFFRRALHIRQESYPEVEYPEGLSELASSHSWLGCSLRELGYLQEAKQHLGKEAELREALRASGHKLACDHCLAGSYRLHAAVCRKLFEYDVAEKDYLQALKLYRQFYSQSKFPEGQELIANCLNGLGIVFDNQSKSERARDYYQQAVDLRRKIVQAGDYPEVRANLEVSLSNLGFVLEDLGERETAEHCFAEASTTSTGAREVAHRRILREKKVGEDLLTTGISRSSAEKAASHFLRALEIAEKAYPMSEFPSGHLDIAENRNYLGACKALMGQIDEARIDLESAYHMLTQLGANGSTGSVPAQASCASMLSFVYNLRGEKAEAARYIALQQQLGKKLDVIRSSSSQRITGVTDTVVTRASIQTREQLLEAKLAQIRSQYPAEKYPNGTHALASAIEDLADYLVANNQPESAEQLLLEAIGMRRGFLRRNETATDRWFFCSVLDRLAKLRQRQRRFSDASDIYNEIYQISVEEGHSGIVWATAGIGVAEVLKHESTEATVKRAITFAKDLVETNDNDVQRRFWKSLVLNALGESLLANGKNADAQELFARAIESQEEALVQFSSIGSESEALNFAYFSQVSLGNLITCWLNNDKHDDTLYKHIWNRRGLLQASISSRLHLMHLAEDPKLELLYKEYLQTRQELAGQFAALATRPAEQTVNAEQALRNLTQHKESLERRLATEFPEFATSTRALEASPEQLITRIPAQSILIDFLRYNYVTPYTKSDGTIDLEKAPHYLATLIQRDESVVCVELGKATPIESQIADWRRAVARNDGVAAENASRKLSSLLWQPLAKHLSKDVTTVYLCPDGALAALAWGALPAPNKQSILLEDYAFAFVPSGRWLLDSLAETSPYSAQTGTFLAVGDVDYDAKVQPPVDLVVSAHRGPLPRDASQTHWLALPGTLEEVRTLQENIPENDAADHGMRLQTLTAEDATVDRVVSALCHARWAHLSTHGFFAAPTYRSVLQLDSASQDFQASYFSGERIDVVGRNPLLLSGLVLAGANSSGDAADTSPGNHENGILSAEGIAALPLQDLDLVVLSACETALGDVAGGEGVFGLQRAFHTAGTKNVVGSLWRVNDAATAFLMEEFYRNMLNSEGLSSLEALRGAQRTVYHHPELVRKYALSRGLKRLNKDPIEPRASKADGKSPTGWWAGFILSGRGE